MTAPRAIRPPLLGAALLAIAIVVGCTSPPSLPGVLEPLFGQGQARAIAVVVLGPDGHVPEARVCATRPGRAEHCDTTDGDGRAVLELVPGTYSVRAVPAPGARLAEGFVTVEIAEDPRVVVTLRGRSTIAGTVRDPEGKPVRAAEACAHATTSDDVECVRTGGDGRYVIEIPPGVHKISYAGPSDGSRLIGQWARGRIDSFEADRIDTRAQDVTGVDVTLARGVVLSGMVTAERDGAVVEDAQVCTYPLVAPLGWQCERTDRRGRYAILREPGAYWVWTIPPALRGSRLIAQRYDRVLVGVEATAFVLRQDRRLDVALGEGPVIRGRVTTADGAPVVLAFVCVDTPFPTGRICRPTGDDGAYEIATRPETYVLSVLPPADSDVIGGYWPGPVPNWTQAGRFRVRGDHPLDVVLPRGVRFYGTVRDPRGAPVEGATVNLNDGSGPRFFASTDIHGHYSVAVAPGAYTVDVFVPRPAELVSVVGHTVVVDVETGYDVVLPDAKP